MIEILDKLKSCKLYIKDFITTLFIIIICIVILIIPDSASSGISNGLNICASILIPSLFPFMVISSFAVRSGASLLLGKLISPIIKTLFNLPGCAGATIILSFIGGYPAGARGIESLLEQGLIDERQANRMLCFNVGAGPAFIISIVGNVLFKNKIIGVILFISQVSASIITGILTGIISRINKQEIKLPYKKSPCISRGLCAIVPSCIDATRSMINMCAFVILFSGMITVIKDSGVIDRTSASLVYLGIQPQIASSALASILEVTVGCIDAVSFGVCPEFISFITGWAGLCVHFQIASIVTKARVNYPQFALFRIVNASLSTIITHIILINSSISAPVFSTVEYQPSASISSTILGSIALVFTCIHFILAFLPPEQLQNLESVQSKASNN